MKKFNLIIFCLSILLLNEDIMSPVSAQCGPIAKGCPGKCDEGYYCAPFWGGQCACFANHSKPIRMHKTAPNSNEKN